MYICASVGFIMHSVQQDHIISSHASEKILIKFHKNLLIKFYGIVTIFLDIITEFWT